jgi:adenosylmethionine-8-amino-7-oxononanoate aminotransferase
MNAIIERTKTMVHCSLAGATHEGAAILAERLLPMCGKTFSKLFFSDDGSTAVEVAIRMARQYYMNTGRPQKKRFVTLGKAFHGETVGAASVSGVDVFHNAMEGLLFETIELPSPGESANGDDGIPWYKTAFLRAEDIMRKDADEIAAVIIEPLVQGAAGMLMYPPEYVKRMGELCRELDILFICDEVFTGYGRTGTFMAHSQSGLEADIVCLAKGFSGGELPMAATITTDRIFDTFLGEPSKTLWYGHSFTGNPLGCAVANATLDVFENENLLGIHHLKAAAIAKGLDSIKDFSWVQDTRQTGILTAFNLVDPSGKSDAGYLAAAGWKFYEEAKKRGALIRPLGNVVYFALPMTVTVEQIDELFHIVRKSLKTSFN